MINVLLLSAGTNACYHCARILKTHFAEKFRLIGADINAPYLVGTTQFLDGFHQVPLSSDTRYYETILEICRKENIRWLLPSFDLDQTLFHSDNEDLNRGGVTSFGVSKANLAFYKDKNATFDFLEANGFPIPKRYHYVESLESNKRYFIKPKNGVGSIGARQAKGSEITDFEHLVVQEICHESEFTTECFFHDGKIATVTRERIVAKAGVCVKTRIFHSPYFEAIAERFARLAQPPKCFNLQFMKNAQGDFVITDVNLRLAGGASLSYAAGWDEISALAKVMMGKPTEEIFEMLPKQVSEQYIVRQYSDIVTQRNKPTMAFDFDGTLLDSRSRHITVLNDILKERHLSLKTDDLIAYKRSNRNTRQFLVAKGLDESVAQDIHKEWIKRIEDERYLEEDRLYDHAHSMLETYAQTYDCILISARNNRDGFFRQVQRLGLEPYFKGCFVVPSNTATPHAKATLLIEHNVCLFIGDTLSDYQAACEAKVTFQHVNTGFHDEALLKSYVPTFNKPILS